MNLKFGDIVWALIGGIAAVVITSWLMGCQAPPEPVISGGKYSLNLEECNRLAKNVCESIACENLHRAAINHAPRTTPKHCISDAGSE